MSTNEDNVHIEKVVQSIEAYVDIRIRDALAQVGGRYNFHVSGIAQARKALEVAISEALRTRDVS